MTKDSIDSVSPEEWDAAFNGYYHDPTLAKQNVDHPPHYNKGSIEAIAYIEQQLGKGFVDYCIGNVMKYLHRHAYKNGKEDLEKAQWYLQRAVDNYEDN